ncbi:helix-turn-helix transcriptional regulator [Brevibacillus sp. NSP2.1]|uniref:helix-turn-helix domain-containing protein n=1 Tax=Brevibacillus agri TaxID=51101 RepID=UPI000552942C|nr:helix-turn-helix transcriptional regulator [Brevibacillus sp. NSP2.1]
MKVVLCVRELLEKHNLTQQELSSMTGIAQSTISPMVRNIKERIDLDHIRRIAEALDIRDMNEIIRIIDEEN